MNFISLLETTIDGTRPGPGRVKHRSKGEGWKAVRHGPSAERRAGSQITRAASLPGEMKYQCERGHYHQQGWLFGARHKLTLYGTAFGRHSRWKDSNWGGNVCGTSQSSNQYGTASRHGAEMQRSAGTGCVRYEASCRLLQLLQLDPCRGKRKGKGVRLIRYSPRGTPRDTPRDTLNRTLQWFHKRTRPL